MWYIFALISIVFTITYGLISKYLLDKHDKSDPIAFASTLFLFVSAWSVLNYLLTGNATLDYKSLLIPGNLLLVLANVVLYSLAPSFYYRALKNLPISQTTILFTFTGLFSLLFGLILKTDIFSINHLIGGLLIIFAVSILQLGQGKWTWNKYLTMMLVSTTFYALAALTDQQIISKNILPLQLFQATSFGVPALLVFLFNPLSARQIPYIWKNKNLILAIFINSILFFFSFLNIYKAYDAGGKAAQVNLLLSTETILTVIFAFVFLKERQNIQIKLLASMLAGVGAFLLR